MEEPNADNPLEPEIAKLLHDDANQFNATAKKWTADYAS